MQRHERAYWRDIHRAFENQGDMPGPEAEVMRDRPGLRAWLNQALFAADLHRLDAFRRAEERLSRAGL